MTSWLNLFFPQWQGSGRRSVYDGAMALKAAIGQGMDLVEIPVGTAEEARAKSNIRDYDVLFRQLQMAIDKIASCSPQRILMIGGDCCSTLAPISYLNRLYQGDLAVIWLDAHGDLNTPESSPSKLFTGMPLRFLLGEGDPDILACLGPPLESRQLVLAGTRDLDPPEAECIDARSITMLRPEQLTAMPEAVAAAVKTQGFKNIYIHVDTDVLSPAAFPFSAWNAPGGIGLETLETVITTLTREFQVVGQSVVEFGPCDRQGIGQIRRIFQVGRLL